MYEALLVVFLIVAIGLVGLIMLQQGKGADMGASFGAGASGTLFGSSGSGNFMTRMTGILAALFFIISLALGNINSNKTNKGSEWDNLSAPKTEQTQPTAPAQPSSDIPHCSYLCVLFISSSPTSGGSPVRGCHKEVWHS